MGNSNVIKWLVKLLGFRRAERQLGHEERTKESDKVICEFLDENPDMIEKVNSGFLRNSTGRHYMDNYTSPEELRKFLEEL